nr:hypothetical protein [Oculatellaceae cyanobacterium Prado106]
MKLLNWLGELNPQLLRELKGRLKPWNVMGAIALSLIGQFLFVMNQYSRLPSVQYSYTSDLQNITHWLCTGTVSTYSKEEFSCVIDAFGSIQINWTLWWQETFVNLSSAGVFVLMVLGTYMLVSNLGQEERRGTFNFIRLSPHPDRKILLGKLLGVPVLLYLALAIAVPLHLWAAVQGQIPLVNVISVYGTLLTGWFFFYSAALLWSLVTLPLGNFQTWVGTGLLLFTFTHLTSGYEANNLIQWLSAFDPTSVLLHIERTVPRTWQTDQLKMLASLEWFHLPYRSSSLSTALFVGAHQLAWSYWIWKGLERRFRSPHAAVWSKGQSYGLVTFFGLLLLGFVWQTGEEKVLYQDFLTQLTLTFWMFLGLIIALSPQRQALQDWARYRHQVSTQ